MGFFGCRVVIEFVLSASLASLVAAVRSLADWLLARHIITASSTASIYVMCSEQISMRLIKCLHECTIWLSGEWGIGRESKFISGITAMRKARTKIIVTIIIPSINRNILTACSSGWSGSLALITTMCALRASLKRLRKCRLHPGIAF